MRARVEPDLAAVARFLDDWDYPRPFDAGATVLALRAERGRRTAGYAWYTAVAELPGALSLHLCLAPDERGRWSRGLLHDLERIPWLLGAERLVSAGLTADAEAMARAAGWAPGPAGTWGVELPGKWGAFHG